MGLFRKKQKEPLRQPHLTAGQDGYAFRRSRTLTGTTSEKIDASARSRSQLKTPRLKAHELRQQQSKVVRLLLALAAGIAILSVVVVNYIAGITVLYPQQARTPAPNPQTYQQTITSYFAQRPFERFGFSLNTIQLENFMRQQHAELSGVTVSKEWHGGNLSFLLYFRQPILTWQTGRERFYVDDQGVAFGYDRFGTKAVAVTDQSGISPESGNTVASKRFIRFLGKMVGAVNRGQKGRVEQVIIPPSTRQIDLKLEGRGYPIKTHIDRDPAQQAEDILNTLGYFDAKGIQPQYVDVRVAGKAFYK